VLQSTGSCVLPTENFDDAVLDPATGLGFYVPKNHQISYGPRENNGRRNKPIRIAKPNTKISSTGVISDMQTSEEVHVTYLKNGYQKTISVQSSS
jgi:hypothetical protein